MPIVYENVPQASLDALDAGQGLLAAGEANLKLMLAEARRDHMAHQPHRTMAFFIQHLGEQAPAENFVDTGWRYIGTQGGVDYSVEVRVDPASQQHSFAMINFSPYIEATRTGLSAAAQHPDIQAHPYHFVLLHVPDVPLLALYFFPEGEAPAYAMVLSPLSVNPSRQQQIMPASELFSLITAEAGKHP